MPFTFEEGPAQTGQSISLTCSVVDGDLPLQISWFLNERPIEDVEGLSQGTIGRRISVLSIESVQADHAGLYMCRAKNKAGHTEYSTELKVNGIQKTELYRLLINFYGCLLFLSIKNAHQHHHQSRNA